MPPEAQMRVRSVMTYLRVEATALELFAAR